MTRGNPNHRPKGPGGGQFTSARGTTATVGPQKSNKSKKLSAIKNYNANKYYNTVGAKTPSERKAHDAEIKRFNDRVDSLASSMLAEIRARK